MEIIDIFNEFENIRLSILENILKLKKEDKYELIQLVKELDDDIKLCFDGKVTIEGIETSFNSLKNYYSKIKKK